LLLLRLARYEGSRIGVAVGDILVVATAASGEALARCMVLGEGLQPIEEEGWASGVAILSTSNVK